MLTGRAFCRLLAVGHLLNLKLCWFWLFLGDFHFLDYQGHPKSSPQKVRNKKGLWTGRFWPTLINSPDTSWKLPPLAKDLRKTRLTCKSGVSLRNRYDYWSQLALQCIIWISWKSIHHRMSVSKGWVLSPKIQFLLSICVSRTSTRLSNHFYPAFRLLKRRKMSE